MSYKIKGILSFPTLFEPKVAKGSDTARYSLVLLLPGDDPQVKTIQAAVDAAKRDTFPNGFPTKGDVCFDTYDNKFGNKDYYDPRFASYYAFTCTAKEDDKPTVVDSFLNPITDRSEVFSGSIVWINAGISGYIKGMGGIGGWLNGVMATGEECEFGRLDNKPSVEQMFAGVSPNAPAAAAPEALPVATTPPPPVPAAPPAPATGLSMTDKAAGAPYQSFIEQGWTDEMLIAQGYAVPAAPTF